MAKFVLRKLLEDLTLLIESDEQHRALARAWRTSPDDSGLAVRYAHALKREGQPVPPDVWQSVLKGDLVNPRKPVQTNPYGGPGTKTAFNSGQELHSSTARHDGWWGVHHGFYDMNDKLHDLGHHFYKSKPEARDVAAAHSHVLSDITKHDGVSHIKLWNGDGPRWPEL